MTTNRTDDVVIPFSSPRERNDWLSKSAPEYRFIRDRLGVDASTGVLVNTNTDKVVGIVYRTHVLLYVR